jgi:hypothetical protein
MEDQPNPHHLVLGELNDFLTGKIIADTLDERFRQKIAKILVYDCGFEKQEIRGDFKLEIRAGAKKALTKIDFLVDYRDKTVMMIKFAPGSLVTRRLATLALSRIIRPYQIPFAIITNGEAAEIIDGYTGRVIAEGLDKLPDRDAVRAGMSGFSFNYMEKEVFDKASRIAYACEIDGACACDSDICVIE